MANSPTLIGRYALYQKLASGGMGSVYIGRQTGLAGFARTVAIKRLHPHLTSDPELVAMFLDEARIAARIRHPNVVGTLDVSAVDGELILVMDYVHGDSLSGILRKLQEKREKLPLRVVSTIICEALYGLHAAHEATRENGEPLRIVHRDVSPQNILVGVDGVTRVVDFGVAKAQGRIRTTEEAGAMRGKLAYMAPEQLLGQPVDRRCDIYAMGIVLWETLSARKYNNATTHGEAINRALNEPPPPIRDYVPDLPDSVVAVIEHAVARLPNERFQTAQAMANALGHAAEQATPPEVGNWVLRVSADALQTRSNLVMSVEQLAVDDTPGLARKIRAGDLAGVIEDGNTPPSQSADSSAQTVLTKAARSGGSTVVSGHSAPPPRQKSSGRWLPVWIAAGVAAIGLLGSYWINSRSTPAPLAGAPSATATSGASPLVSSPGAPLPAAPSVAPAASSSAPDAGPRVPDAASPTPRPTTPPQAPPPKRPCEYHENGIKKYNPDCL